MRPTSSHRPFRPLAPTLALAVALTALPAAGLAQDVEAPTCEAGWSDLEWREDIAPETVAVLSPQEVWVGGGSMLGGGRRQAVALHGSDGEWTLELPPQPDTRDSGFMGIASAGPGDRVWAVGFARETDYVAAITAVRDDKGWKLTNTMRPGGDSATLTDVAADPEAGVWAVGFIQGPPGQQQPWILERSGGEWERSRPPIEAGERATLAAISAAADAGVWAAGTALDDPRMHPYLVHLEDGRWVRHEVAGLAGAALADIDVPAVNDGWAVGHRLAGPTIEPLLLHWDGSTWTEFPGPEPGAGPTLLSSVSAEDGVLSVGGSSWDPERRRYSAFAARDDGSGWTISRGRRSWGMGTITDLDGDPGRNGWSVGRMDQGLVGRVCGAPDGSLEPVEPVEPAADAASTTTTPAAAAGARSPSPAGPIKGELRAVDVAAKAGLPTASQSWGSVAADFDGDGLDDIFLGRHGARARLFLNQGGTFVDTERKFGGGDRHGCAAADVDGSGLADLYCSFGASRGTGTKANQLWLDPGGPEASLHPLAGGATEPLGRGREARFLDIDEDGDEDLFLGQETKRMDGRPSLNQAYLRTGPAAFEAAAVPGIDTGLATESLGITDYDGDGREDILLVYWDLRATSPKSGLRLYRNEEGVAFTDVTDATGIETIGERDAALTDLDGDGRPDLIQLSEERLVVSLSRDGRFKRVFERSVTEGRALATGDADGDGDADVYVLQGKSKDGARDRILLNDGDGRSFGSVEVPEVKGGSEDEVIALDYDADGRTDFLALNGRNSERGPVQLITLRPA